MRKTTLLTKPSVKSDDSSKLVKEQRLTLREQQDRNLAADVKSVLSYRAYIKAQTNNTFDSTRILGIVAAAKGAENYLPYTIPKIVKQISDIGLIGDIVIGLNNGFECPDVIDLFSVIPNVKIIHLYTGKKIANNIPAPIFDNSLCKGEPYCITNMNPQHFMHRIFVVHQKEGEYAAGKIQVLGDIYSSLIIKSIDDGWIPPKILVTFDAESQFLIEQDYSNIELESNGLQLIVNELQNHPEIDILGTRHKFAVYRREIVNRVEVLVPNFREELPPIQWFLNIVHGRFCSFMTKPGGGTFGKTDVMVSLLAVIAERYPGSRCEDCHSTILAKHAGFLGDILVDVVSTNRTPNITDITADSPPKRAWIKQVSRWASAVEALKLHYGEHNIKMIVDSGLIWLPLRQQFELLCRLMSYKNHKIHTIIKKIEFLMVAFLISQTIKKQSIRQPDILQGSEAKGWW